MVLRPFESEIIDRFLYVGKGSHYVTGAKGIKGVWIRGYLEYVGTDYPYSMFANWRDFCIKAQALGAMIKPGDYQAFRTYVHLLKKLRLIRVVRRVRTPRGRLANMYRVVAARRDDPAWTRPFQSLYATTDWTLKTPEEKKELRRRWRERKRVFLR